MIFGRDARALLNAVQSGTGPGLTAGEPAMAEVFVMPGRMIARMSEQAGAPVSVNVGDLPVRMRIEPAGEGPGGLIDMDVAIPVAFVEAMLTLTMGTAAAPPQPGTP